MLCTVVHRGLCGSGLRGIDFGRAARAVFVVLVANLAFVVAGEAWCATGVPVCGGCTLLLDVLHVLDVLDVLDVLHVLDVLDVLVVREFLSGSMTVFLATTTRQQPDNNPTIYCLVGGLPRLLVLVCSATTSSCSASAFCTSANTWCKQQAAEPAGRTAYHGSY